MCVFWLPKYSRHYLNGVDGRFDSDATGHAHRTAKKHRGKFYAGKKYMTVATADFRSGTGAAALIKEAASASASSSSGPTSINKGTLASHRSAVRPSVIIGEAGLRS